MCAAGDVAHRSLLAALTEVGQKKRPGVRAKPWPFRRRVFLPGSKTGSQELTCAAVLYFELYKNWASLPIGLILHLTA